MGPDDADSIACRLEHVTPVEVAGRLDRFLKHPAVGPMGRPIPPASDSPPRPTVSLDGVAVGARVEVVSIDEAKEFLESVGIRPGAVIAVRARAGSGTLIAADDVVSIDEDIAISIRVTEVTRGV
jgi:Fe2+ transport system protein FeoA